MMFPIPEEQSNAAAAGKTSPVAEVPMTSAGEAGDAEAKERQQDEWKAELAKVRINIVKGIFVLEVSENSVTDRGRNRDASPCFASEDSNGERTEAESRHIGLGRVPQGCQRRSLHRTRIGHVSILSHIHCILYMEVFSY